MIATWQAEGELLRVVADNIFDKYLQEADRLAKAKAPPAAAPAAPPPASGGCCVLM